VENGVFFIATPATAGAIGGGAGLTSTAAFENATSVLLADAYDVYYADFDNLSALLELAATLDPAGMDEDLEEGLALMALLESATISRSIDAEDVTRVRATIQVK